MFKNTGFFAIYTFILAFTLLYSGIAKAQQAETQFIKTQAIITALDSRIIGRTLTVTAKVSYVAESGDSLSSQTRLMHIPIIGSFKEVGDTIIVLYQKDNPYLIKTKEESFWQTCGLYALMALGIVVTGYRLIKVKKAR